MQERGHWVDPESQSSHILLSCVTSDRMCRLSRTQFYYPITSFNNGKHIMDRDENLIDSSHDVLDPDPGLWGLLKQY